MDLLYFIKVLFRKKWIIIGLSFLAVVTAFFVLINKQQLYTSVAQYSTGFTAEKVKLVDGTSAIDLYIVDVRFDNVIETIKSPQVLSRVSYSLLLHDLMNPSSAFVTLTQSKKETALYREVNKDSAIIILTNKLANNEILRTDIRAENGLAEYLKLFEFDYFSILEKLVVNRVARTDYLDIIYSSHNPYLSATVVNSIGQEFLNYYRGLNLRRTGENEQSIIGLVEAQQRKVDSLGQKLLAEKISQGTIDPLSRTTSAMETVTELESRLAEEKGKYNQHKNRLEYLTARYNSLASVSSSSSSNDEVVKLINKKNQLVDELSRKGGNDPVLEKQINDLRSEINSKSNVGSNKSKTKGDLDDLSIQINEERALLNASKTTIADYDGRIRRYMGMTNVNPGSGIKMDAIQTQLDMENKQLGNVKEMYNQVQGLAKDDPTSNFIQTRVGQPPAEPNTKKTMLKMALSGISVFFLSAVFFIFLEIFDSSVKTPGMFAKATQSKAANVINFINLKRRSATDAIIEEGTVKEQRKILVFKNNIRKLRYELLHSGKKIFLFTSTQRKTGKSTIVQALAASLLLSKKKVLIIDFNFANNTLTNFFGTDVFIEDVASNNSYTIDKKISTGKTSYNDLEIIGCAQHNTTPSEVLYNLDVNAFFRNLKLSYDFILMEAGALNNYADARELAAYADGIFTVFSADCSVLPVDMESLNFISKEMKEKDMGLVLNKVLTENINS